MKKNDIKQDKKMMSKMIKSSEIKDKKSDMKMMKGVKKGMKK